MSEATEVFGLMSDKALLGVSLKQTLHQVPRLPKAKRSPNAARRFVSVESPGESPARSEMGAGASGENHGAQPYFTFWPRNRHF